jgi:hypothetical protein
MTISRRKFLASLFVLPAAVAVPAVAIPWWKRWYRKLRKPKGATADQLREAGFVWAPYIPLQVTPTFLDPNDFKPISALRPDGSKVTIERYSRKVLRTDFYGKVKLWS